MRVVSGKLRGKRLGSFKGFDIRPTTDRVREALFSILATRIPLSGAGILDLFAGSGAVGIEALSRGAASVCFVDSDSASIKVIEKNLKACGLEGSAKILKRDASLAVQGLARRGDRFELIFLDPPYSSSLLTEVVYKIASNTLLSPEGLLVAETSKRAPLFLETGVEAEAGAEVGNLRIDEVRSYGDTLLYLFSYAQQCAEEETKGVESSVD